MRAIAHTLEPLVSGDHVVLGEVVVVGADEADAVADRVETGGVGADDGPATPLCQSLTVTCTAWRVRSATSFC